MLLQLLLWLLRLGDRGTFASQVYSRRQPVLPPPPLPAATIETLAVFIGKVADKTTKGIPSNQQSASRVADAFDVWTFPQDKFCP